MNIEEIRKLKGLERHIALQEYHAELDKKRKESKKNTKLESNRMSRMYTKLEKVNKNGR
jgi:hypothetical protein